MSKTYVVIVTPWAEGHIQSIVHYIRSVIGSQSGALRLSRIFRSAIHDLRFFPNRYPLIEDEPWHSEGYRKMVVEDYNFYYWVSEPEETVYVAAVVNHRRNQLPILNTVYVDKGKVVHTSHEVHDGGDVFYGKKV